MSATTEREPMALTYDEAGRAMGVSPRTVWGLVASGKLRAVRIGRCVRIARAELERFLAAGQEGGGR